MKPIESTGHIQTIAQREAEAVRAYDLRLDHIAHGLLTLGKHASARLVEEARKALKTEVLP